MQEKKDSEDYGEDDKDAQGAEDREEADGGEREDTLELNNESSEEPVRWKRTLAWQEVYKDRAPVVYWSSTHQMMIQARIRGSGRFRSLEQLPRYSVEVGLRRQLRKDVPLCDLHPALEDGDPVVFWDSSNSWKYGMISKILHWGIYEVTYSESGEEKVHQDISLDRIRRRFSKDLPVQVYRGRRVGWRLGTVLEEPLHSHGESSGAPEVSMVQVLLDGEEEPVSVASYLIQTNDEFVQEHI